MNRMFRILEIVWLTIGITGIFLCAYFIIKEDREQAIYFLVITVVAGIMYSVRRRQRKKQEEIDKTNN